MEPNSTLVSSLGRSSLVSMILEQSNVDRNAGGVVDKARLVVRGFGDGFRKAIRDR